MQSNPRKSFRINERWPNKWNIQNSTINKRRLVQRTWRRFWSIRTIYLCQQEVTPNWHPCQGLPQICEGSKSLCPVWIQITYNLQSYTRTSIVINKIWYNQHEKTSQQSIIIRSKLKLQNKLRYNLGQILTLKRNLLKILDL